MQTQTPQTLNVARQPGPAVYTIHILGAFLPEWADWFDGMQMESCTQGGDPVTVLTGPVADQAALRGLLNRLWNLNLTILAASCLPGPIPGSRQQAGQPDGN